MHLSLLPGPRPTARFVRKSPAKPAGPPAKAPAADASRRDCRLLRGSTSPGTAGRAPTTSTPTHAVKKSAAHVRNAVTGTGDCFVTRAVRADSGSSCHRSRLTCSARSFDAGIVTSPPIAPDPRGLRRVGYCGQVRGVSIGRCNTSSTTKNAHIPQYVCIYTVWKKCNIRFSVSNFGNASSAPRLGASLFGARGASFLLARSRWW